MKKCYPELTLAMFVDGEAPADLALAIHDHLDLCPGCRSLAGALRLENRVVAQAVQASIAGAAAPWASSGQEGRVWVGLTAMLALAVTIGLPLNWIARGGPAAFEWLNPFQSSGRLTLSFGMGFYLLSGGFPLISAIAAASTAVLFLSTLVLVAVLLERRGKSFQRLVLSLSLAVAFVIPGFAVTTRTSQHVTLPQSETVNDTLVATGREVRIDGAVNGDLAAFGETVIIRGPVKGDVVLSGGFGEVLGNVEGNVLAFAQTVQISGRVRGNVYVCGQNLRLSPNSQVEGEVIGGGSTIDLEGSVLRGALLAGDAVTVSGSVGRDLKLYVRHASLLSSTRITGKTAAWVRDKRDVTIESGAVVPGGVDIHIEEAVRWTSRFTKLSFYTTMLKEFLGALIAGCVLLLVARGFLMGAAVRVRSFWRSFGIGFVVLVATPVALVVVAITIVGLPLALITFALYAAAVYLSKIVVAAFLGQAMYKGPLTRFVDCVLVLILGLIPLTVAFRIPFGIGFGLRVVVLCFGLGALIWQIYRGFRDHVAAP